VRHSLDFTLLHKARSGNIRNDVARCSICALFGALSREERIPLLAQRVTSGTLQLAFTTDVSALVDLEGSCVV
jgi:hypothetical protein